MNIEQQPSNLEIIAGPCSISPDNFHEIFDIADIHTKNQRGEIQRGVAGTRVVGLKSRTSLMTDGKSMGIDFPVISDQISAHILVRENTPPSVLMAEQIVRETDLMVATEIMIPEIQIPHFIGKIPEGKLLLWNPSVDQLGWHMMQISRFAKEQGWLIGVKNGKTLGSTLSEANDPNRQLPIELERTWAGLASFAQGIDGRLVLIHRGIESPDKGEFRSALVHEVAKRVKRSVSHSRLFFDPSHSCGPKLRDQIVSITIDAMRMRDGNEFLYDGILVETGHSDTDTNQHISIDELSILVKELSTFRVLKEPTSNTKIRTCGVIFPSIQHTCISLKGGEHI
jgi:hypothetical protein